MSENIEQEAPVIEIAVMGGWLVNFVIHTWTVILSYQIRGFWPMVLTLLLPGAAEFYWAYMLWDAMPYYSIIAVTVVVLFWVLRVIAKAASPDQH